MSDTERDAAFRAGMKTAEGICHATAAKIEKEHLSRLVNQAHNCAVYIGLNEMEMSSDDITAAILAHKVTAK